MKLNSKRKKTHILTFFQSESKKFNFYFKIRAFNCLNIKNFFLKKKYDYGLMNLKSRYLYINPLLSCIKLIKFFLKLFLLEKSNLFVLVFPDFVLTSKPREVRMGKGKGRLHKKVVLLKKNTLLFFLNKIQNDYCAYYILNQCQRRLPFKTKLVYKLW